MFTKKIIYNNNCLNEYFHISLIMENINYEYLETKIFKLISI